jgi:uncharacterized membrane protein
MGAPQKGSILINAAVALGLAVTLLIGMDLGYLFYMKREMQKSADLSALAGAPQLKAFDCSEAEAAALANAAVNMPGFTPTVECGNWAPSHANDSHYESNQTPYNAVRVNYLATPPPLLPMPTIQRTIGVEAIAAIDEPIAAFSVGSRLLRLEADSLIPSLLRAAGLGLSDTDLLSYQGLQNTAVTAAGLLTALGIPVTADMDVGTLNALTDIQNLTVGQLLSATALSLQNQGPTLLTQVTLLNQVVNGLNSDTLNSPIRLFGTLDVAGVLVGLDDTGPAALNAKVDVLSLVTTSLVIANGEHLIDIPALSVGPLGVTVKTSVIEPPTIGIGGVGTIAQTAQIRTFIRINSNNIPLVGSILGALGTGFDLPLILEVGQSSGELTAIDCESPRQNATIAVSSSSVNVCVGQFHDMSGGNDQDDAHFFSDNNSCTPDGSGQVPDTIDGVQRHAIVSVLGQPLNARVGLNLLSAESAVSTGPLNEPSDPLDGTHQATIGSAPLSLSQSASNVADAVAVGILGDLLDQGGNGTAAQQLELATSLVGTGNGGRGKTTAEVSQELQDANTAADGLLGNLTSGINSGGLGGLLGGVLNGLGSTVGNLGNFLGGTVVDLCLLQTAAACRNSRINYISNMLASDSNFLSTSLNMTIGLLDPILDSLSTVLNNLLDQLGVNFGETDVEVISVSCGRPKLVY